MKIIKKINLCKKCGEDLAIKAKQGWVKSGNICGECVNKINNSKK